MRRDDWKRLRCANCVGHGLREAFGGGPAECRECDGGGFYYVHESGTLALWPGGPLKGSLTRAETAYEFRERF